MKDKFIEMSSKSIDLFRKPVRSNWKPIEFNRKSIYFNSKSIECNRKSIEFWTLRYVIIRNLIKFCRSGTDARGENIFNRMAFLIAWWGYFWRPNKLYPGRKIPLIFIDAVHITLFLPNLSKISPRSFQKFLSYFVAAIPPTLVANFWWFCNLLCQNPP